MCDIPADISKDELERRIEVFGAGHYGVGLTVILHGRAFRYSAPEAESKVDAPSIVPSEQVVEPAVNRSVANDRRRHVTIISEAMISRHLVALLNLYQK